MDRTNLRRIKLSQFTNDLATETGLSRPVSAPIGIIGALMFSMVSLHLFLALFLFATSSMAKTMCSIPISGAVGDFIENGNINKRLKPHQQIKMLSFSIDLENLQNDKNSKIKLVFETIQAKKFETTYNVYNKKSQVWKVDFSKSQIFPLLLKNYMNITYYNSKYYLRLYDMPSEKTIVNFIFDSAICSPSNKSMLSRAGL